MPLEILAGTKQRCDMEQSPPSAPSGEVQGEYLLERVMNRRLGFHTGCFLQDSTSQNLRGHNRANCAESVPYRAADLVTEDVAGSRRPWPKSDHGCRQ